MNNWLIMGRQWFWSYLYCIRLFIQGPWFEFCNWNNHFNRHKWMSLTIQVIFKFSWTRATLQKSVETSLNENTTNWLQCCTVQLARARKKFEMTWKVCPWSTTNYNIVSILKSDKSPFGNPILIIRKMFFPLLKLCLHLYNQI